jgi:hypothetical protein
MQVMLWLRAGAFALARGAPFNFKFFHQCPLHPQRQVIRTLYSTTQDFEQTVAEDSTDNNFDLTA